MRHDAASEREFDRGQADMTAKRSALEAQIGALQHKIKVQDELIGRLVLEQRARESSRQNERRAMSLSRRADVEPAAARRSRAGGRNP